MKEMASIKEIEKLTYDLVVNGGNPEGIYELLHSYEFTIATLNLAIDIVMNSHSDSQSLKNALLCRQIMQYEIRVLEKRAHRV